jgi:BON domain
MKRPAEARGCSFYQNWQTQDMSSRLALKPSIFPSKCPTGFFLVSGIVEAPIAYELGRQLATASHEGTWGVVRNEEEKNAIRVAAEGTPGVQAVNDHLRVYS